MAKVLIGSELGSYAFNKVAKTVTFSGFTPSLERLLLITDVTNGTVIYQFNDGAANGTLSGNVLTLDYDTNTASFANTDKLQIFYWSEEPQQTALYDMAVSIRRDLQMIRRNPFDTPQGLSVNLIGGTLPTVGNLQTLQFIGSASASDSVYGAFPSQLQFRDAFNTYKSKIIS